MKKISVVIPMYYEEEVAQICYDRVSEVLEKLKKEYDYEIIFVNDGSKDKTLSIMQELRKKDKRICYLNLSRNYGKETAMIAGLDYCK